MEDEAKSKNSPRLAWPKFALAAVVAALVLAVLWMTFAVLRLQKEHFPESDSVPTSTRPPTNSPVADRLTSFRDVLSGGDAAAGRKVFFEKPEANCAKCHKIEGQGGDTGPALDGIATKLTREEVLESLILPNRRITEGYDSVILLLKDGTGRSGFLKDENESELTVLTSEDGLVKIDKRAVKLRQRGMSPMPEGLDQLLSRDDLRNVIEFIATLKTPEARNAAISGTPDAL